MRNSNINFNEGVLGSICGRWAFEARSEAVVSPLLNVIASESEAEEKNPENVKS